MRKESAERDSSGILFIAAVLQKQPSTGEEALRDVIKRNKKIQADSPVFVLAQGHTLCLLKSKHKNPPIKTEAMFLFSSIEKTSCRGAL